MDTLMVLPLDQKLWKMFVSLVIATFVQVIYCNRIDGDSFIFVTAWVKLFVGRAKTSAHLKLLGRY